MIKEGGKAPERILIADDEEVIRTLLQRVLIGAGYSVVATANGKEALDKMSQLKVKLVLLDNRMPGMSGMEVLQEITAHWPDTCVIMVSAVLDTQTAAKAMKLGAYDYIPKPFDLNTVIRTVQRAIETRDILSENGLYRFDFKKRAGEQRERLQPQFARPGEVTPEHSLSHK